MPAVAGKPVLPTLNLAKVKQSHDDALGGPPTSSRIHRGGGGEGVGITDGVGGSTARGSYREGYSHGSAAGATGNHSNAGASYLRQSLSSSQGARGAGAASGSSTARGGQLGTPGRQPQYGAAEGSSYAVRSSLSYQNTVGGGGGGGGSASASQALLAAQLSSQRAVLTSSHGRSGGHGAAGSGAGAGAGAGAGQGVGSSAANIAAAAAAAAAVSLQAQQQYAHALATPRGHYGSTAASASHMHLSGSGAPASGATQAAAAAAAAGTGAIQGSRAAYQAAGAPPTTSASTAQRHQQLTQQPEQHRRRESSGAEAAAVAVSTAALAHSASGYGARPPVGAAAAAAAAAHYTASGNTTSAANAASGAAATATHTSTATAAASSTAAATAAAATTATAAAVTWESGYITPAQALSRYAEYMTPYEHSEVLEYQQVYFVGRSSAQKVNGNPHAGGRSNFGYDDERGDYVVVLHDHMAYRYEVLSVMGRGSFGQVLKVHDFKTNTLRAVKVIRNKKRFHQQALVELRVLQHIRDADPEDRQNCVHIGEHFYFRGHLCISFELLSVNLYDFIKQNNFMGLSLGLIRRFAHQILISLRYMKSLRLIHCDLKPENILLRQPNRSAIKVIDFGSSCYIEERVYTYIQSRFYRSPEVILGCAYGVEIDMWSLGCILAELFTGYPLFPGEDEVEQLACMMEVVGLPPVSLLEAASRRKLFFDSAGNPRLQPNSQGRTRMPGTKTLQGLLKCNDPGFLDLLEKCLRWDPATRITPEQALQHVWIMDANPSPTSRNNPLQQQGGNSNSNSNSGGVAVAAAGAAGVASTEKGSVAHLPPNSAAAVAAALQREKAAAQAAAAAAGAGKPHVAAAAAVAQGVSRAQLTDSAMGHHAGGGSGSGGTGPGASSGALGGIGAVSGSRRTGKPGAGEATVPADHSAGGGAAEAYSGYSGGAAANVRASAGHQPRPVSGRVNVLPAAEVHVAGLGSTVLTSAPPPPPMVPALDFSALRASAGAAGGGGTAAAADESAPLPASRTHYQPAGMHEQQQQAMPAALHHLRSEGTALQPTLHSPRSAAAPNRTGGGAAAAGSSSGTASASRASLVSSTGPGSGGPAGGSGVQGYLQSSIGSPPTSAGGVGGVPPPLQHNGSQSAAQAAAAVGGGAGGMAPRGPTAAAMGVPGGGAGEAAGSGGHTSRRASAMYASGPTSAGSAGAAAHAHVEGYDVSGGHGGGGVGLGAAGGTKYLPTLATSRR